MIDDDLLDDIFHGCAFAAYVELAAACRGVPDMDATRMLAYRYYEEQLAERNAKPEVTPADTTDCA